MLRIALLVIVLANLMFFVWSQGYLGGTDSGRETQRLLAQVAPEKLQLQPAAAPPPLAAPVAPAPLCRRISGFAAEGGEGLASDFRAKLPGLAITSSMSDLAARFVVAIGGLASKEAAATKLAQVKAFGVTAALSVEEEGGGSYRIVIGSAVTSAAANEQLANLSKRGLKSPRVLEVQAASKTTVLELRGAEAGFAPLAGLLNAYPGAHVEDCPPPSAGQ